MAARGEALAAAPPQQNVVSEALSWLWDFLKNELTPYPGRAWVVARVTIAATLVMLIVMTFRIPAGFLGAIFVLFLSRENPTATLVAGAKAISFFCLGTVFSLLGAALFVDDPLTHFVAVGVGLLASFYLISIMNDYGTSVAFGFTIAGAIPLWDRAELSVNERVSNTLWLGGVVAIGIVVTIVVEYIFRSLHPTTDLTEGIEARVQTVENVLRCAAEERPLDTVSEKRLALFTMVGISRLRRLIIRSQYSAHFKAQLGTAVALVGQLIDVAGNFHRVLNERAKSAATNEAGFHMDPADKARCHRLASQIEILSKDLVLRRMPEKIQVAEEQPSKLPFLSSMERIVALIPEAFSGSTTVHEFVPAPLDEEQPTRFFAADAFSNPAHLQFALRGTLAALASYIIYTAIAWPGLSTSIATCIITALSTIGSSRQKQFLRLMGAIVGGIIFGFGAQIFVLPYLDSIVGFTIVFALVTAISSWIATSSTRLSYLGVQLALAFYLINLQEFTIQISLSIARDRVFGVLLGLMCMWLIYDRLWVKDALEEMQTVFARNLEMFAELAEQMLEPDRAKAIQRIRQLRDKLNAGFQAVNAQADAVVFEFGPARSRKLQIRENIRRWQPAIRTLLQVQVTSAQYLVRQPLSSMPQPIAEAGVAFEKDIAAVMRALSNEVNGKRVDGVPDIRQSSVRMQEATQNYYLEAGEPVPTQASDLLGLARSLATILAPLYEDIRDTFAGANYPYGSTQLAPGQA
ncbi:MAG TPA: FUSC family protein [Acidobacteriaceae bacterium]|nr:FUSC family protein [Acidobacteriaceae bacterium]